MSATGSSWKEDLCTFDVSFLSASYDSIPSDVKLKKIQRPKQGLGGCMFKFLQEDGITIGLLVELLWVHICLDVTVL